MVNPNSINPISLWISNDPVRCLDREQHKLEEKLVQLHLNIIDVEARISCVIQKRNFLAATNAKITKEDL